MAVIGTQTAQGAGTRIYHSHRYHALLQRTLQDVEKVDAAALLSRAAAEAVYRHLQESAGWSGQTPARERLAEVADLFRESGLGRLELEGVGVEGGEATVTGSFFARPARLPASRTAPDRLPSCAPVAGFLRGALAAVHGRDYQVTETSCGGARGRCRFRVLPAAGAEPLADEVVHPVPAGAAAPPEGWQEREMVGELLDGSLLADGDGQIRALGEELAHLWGDYYARVCYRFEREIPRVMGNKFGNLGSIVLTEAGHLYAYYALGGILVSDEWHARVAPRLRDREHWADALVALITALGWGSWRIRMLVPGERLAVVVHDSYEGTGYRRLYGRTSAAKCYLSRGAAAAVMNLLYVGDITARPELGVSHYNDLFRSPVSFRAMETRCRAMDDPICEFVVNPLSPALSERMRNR